MSYLCDTCTELDECRWRALMKLVDNNICSYIRGTFPDLAWAPIKENVVCNQFKPKKEESKMKQKVTLNLKFNLCNTCIHGGLCKHEPLPTDGTAVVEFPFSSESPIKVKDDIIAPISCELYRRII